jgi:hypothetical protein
MSEVFIHNYVLSTIDNIIKKWEETELPFRLVMVQTNFCYICKKHKEETWEKYSDDFNGKYNRYGWIYCNDCKNICLLAQSKYLEENNYLSYSDTKFLRKRLLSFWRVSSNKSINPYIQKEAKIMSYTNNSIFLSNNRLCVPVSWGDNFYFTKSIYLANLIHFNKDYIYNCLKELLAKPLHKKWIKLIKNEIDLSNSWDYFKLISDKYNIPNFIIRRVSMFWGGFN